MSDGESSRVVAGLCLHRQRIPVSARKVFLRKCYVVALRDVAGLPVSSQSRYEHGSGREASTQRRLKDRIKFAGNKDPDGFTWNSKSHWQWANISGGQGRSDGQADASSVRCSRGRGGSVQRRRLPFSLPSCQKCRMWRSLRKARWPIRGKRCAVLSHSICFDRHGNCFLPSASHRSTEV